MTDEIKGQLGDLELVIMDVLWKAGEPLQVNQVVTALGHQRAYTTVMTTLSRLYEKGYLNQDRVGRAYTYKPRLTRANVLKRMWSRFADVLTGGDMVELIPHLLGKDGKLTQQERDFLQNLADGIKDKKS